jgi:hypothetical protein
MGDVQNPRDTVLQAKTDSDEGVYPAREQAPDRDVQELHHHDRSLLRFTRFTSPKAFADGSRQKPYPL